MPSRFLLTCSFRPRSAAAAGLLDRLVGGPPDGGRADPATGVVTRGWVVWGDQARGARRRLADTPGVWGMALDPWPAPRPAAVS